MSSRRNPDVRVEESRSGGAVGYRTVVVVSAILLVSFGGAIIVAPFSLPLLLRASNRAFLSRGWRIVAVVVFGLTLAECSWAVFYVLVGEESPYIWLIPTLVLFTSTGALLARTARTQEAAVGGT